LLTAFACLALIACLLPGAGFAQSAGDAAPAFDPPFARIIFVGETVRLAVRDVPDGASLAWRSSDETVATVDETGLVEGVSSGRAVIECDISTGDQTRTIRKIIYARETPMNPAEVKVNEDGFDAAGRMVAMFGSPVVDGKVDDVWEKAIPVRHRIVAGETDTEAVFRVLWDDRALYVLAEVKDSRLSVEADAPYMQDSVEIFLDENNDKTVSYGPDDLHFRVNYENVRSIDNGDGDRFFTAVAKTGDGYIIEARVALSSP